MNYRYLLGFIGCIFGLVIGFFLDAFIETITGIVVRRGLLTDTRNALLNAIIGGAVGFVVGSLLGGMSIKQNHSIHNREERAASPNGQDRPKRSSPKSGDLDGEEKRGRSSFC
jgi:hypothetical protein